MAGDPQSTVTAWAVFSAIGGSIVGSILGGGISYYLARLNLRAAKKQREDDRYEVRRGQAFSLFFKMVRIHSTIVALRTSVAECMEKLKAPGCKETPWQVLLPMGNLPPRVKFSPEEMALLLSLDIDLFNDVGPYDDIHNSLLDIFELYRTKREALTQRFGAVMKGPTGTTFLTKEDAEWMAPRAFELNNVAGIMVQRTEDDSKESKGLLERMHALFVKEFKLNPKLEFKDPK